jgi:hypothetical protein
MPASSAVGAGFPTVAHGLPLAQLCQRQLKHDSAAMGCSATAESRSASLALRCADAPVLSGRLKGAARRLSVRALGRELPAWMRARRHFGPPLYTRVKTAAPRSAAMIAPKPIAGGNAGIASSAASASTITPNAAAQAAVIM